MQSGHFLRQFWRAPSTVGAVMPSSRALADRVVAPIDFATAKAVVELGPGTGAFTRAIAKRLKPGARYLGIEINPSFVRLLEHDFPHLDFEAGSAEALGRVLAARNMGEVDAIVSGLPWASLPPKLQDTVFDEMGNCLRPGGVFVTFAFLQGLMLPGARALRHRLGHEFTTVRRTPIVWHNVPPAFAYVCVR